jgi:hypothetical protein
MLTPPPSLTLPRKGAEGVLAWREYLAPRERGEVGEGEKPEPGEGSQLRIQVGGFAPTVPSPASLRSAPSPRFAGRGSSGDS